MSYYSFIAPDNPILTLPENLIGRDIIIGDVHGKYELLAKLLSEVNVKPDDRVIFCGDLTDRGEHSDLCMELLFEPNYYVVRGNHDNMLISAIIKHYPDIADEVLGLNWVMCNDSYQYQIALEFSCMMDNGGDWFLTEYFSELIKNNPKLLATWLKKLIELPIAIKITGSKPYQIIHAGLHPNWNQEMISNAYYQALDQENKDLFVNTLLWGRSIVNLYREQFEDSKRIIPENNFLPTICGHSVVREPLYFNKHFFIDTGSFLASSGSNHGITAMIIQDETMVKISGEKYNFKIRKYTYDLQTGNIQERIC